MRIISGKFRSRNLKAAGHLRPTTDRVRETLFNILQSEIEDSTFVDAFAGTGSAGIEAISRGAGMVYFLESNRKSLLILRENLQTCCAEEVWRILAMDVLKGLPVLKQQCEHVDLLFFDPPYDYDQYSGLLDCSIRLFPEATNIVEHSSRFRIDPSGLVECVRSKDIGETQLSFFRKS